MSYYTRFRPIRLAECNGIPRQSRGFNCEPLEEPAKSNRLRGYWRRQKAALLPKKGHSSGDRLSIENKNSFRFRRNRRSYPGLHPTMFWISASQTSIHGIGPTRIRTRHSSGSRLEGCLIKPWPLPVSDGPRKPSVDRVHVQLCEPCGSDRLAGCASTLPIFFRAHDSGGSPRGKRDRFPFSLLESPLHPFFRVDDPVPFSLSRTSGLRNTRPDRAA